MQTKDYLRLLVEQIHSAVKESLYEADLSERYPQCAGGFCGL